MVRGCKIWTDEERHEIKELYASGRSYRDIAEHFGVSYPSVSKQILMLGLSSRRKPYSPRDKDYIRKHHATKSYKQIAKDLGRSYGGVRRFAAKMGLEHNCGESHRLCKFSDNDIELMRQLHDDGCSVIDIALKMEAHYDYVSSVVNYKSRAYISVQ
ncbi:helix-turn-helix domain-containing protein [Vibrio bathopelagicus]|uniref:helix-turn-helix domain-containing protein n=1 Tax=Vibrio bathopelagicus TaxID=2777577 RepID=UPI001864F775|nr:helix-turn-helix domain-containing protein [Vibrio bathopelagicus]